MDPNLFHLDWDRTLEVLAAVVVLSLLLERALAILFESRMMVKRLEGTSLKEIIAFVVAAVVCVRWKFDAISMTVLTERTSLIGEFVTAGVIAGGSKGSIKLFRDVLGFKSSAYAEKEERKRIESATAKANLISELQAKGLTPQMVQAIVGEPEKK